MTMLPTVAFNEDASPADAIAGECSFSLPIQALLCCVGVQAQYQAFVRCCGPRKRRSFLSAIALNRFCVLEPIIRCGSRFERPGLPPYRYGCLHRCRARNVVAPGQYSKWFLGDS